MSSSAQEEPIQEIDNIFSSPVYSEGYLKKAFFPGISIVADDPSIPDSYDDTCHQFGRKYYGRVLTWLHNEFSSGRHTGKRVLNICCGPTIINSLSASMVFEEIIMADINKPCLDEITNWVKGGPEAHDLNSFTSFVASLEDQTTEYVESRLKKAVKQTVQFNIHDDVPLGEQVIPVDCVIGVLALSSASCNVEDFKRNLIKTVSFLQPGGTMLLVMVLHSPGYYYVIGEKYPELALKDVDSLVESMSESGLDEIVYEKYPTPDSSPLPNQCYLCISAKKKN